jgi:vacuolar protein sorting-associated protein 35
VQYAGNIVPRLYLLITVGSVYIRSKEAPAKEVLKDLVEMCKGVQHPTRGLFIRSYLSEMTKDKLPDEGSQYAGEKGGNIRDCIEFIVQNFTDMNKLWVRMQHQGSIREKEKREQERKELGPLIGKMLSRLSNLEGLTATLYASHVLPTLVEQISSCKDAIAQEYLMECTVQVFPDEFHLMTLGTILETAAGLVEGVDVKSIVVNLTDRLVAFVKSNRDKINPTKGGVDMFDVFFAAISRITQERKSMPAEDVLSLYKSLMDLTIQVYPKSLANVDKIFSVAGPVLAAKKEESPAILSNQRVVKGVLALLRSPLENYHNILTVLALQNYPSLFEFLAPSDRRRACLDVVRAVIEDGVHVPSPEHADALLRLVSPLIVDREGEEGAQDEEEDDPQAFAEEQNLVGSLVHVMRARGNPGVDFEMLLIVRKYFGMGGKLRIRHSVPPLVFRAIEVARALHASSGGEAADWEEKGQRVYKFLLGTTKTFVELVKMPDLSFRLLLNCAQSASETGFQAVAYQFMEKAYTIYEQDITDSVAQFNAMNLLIPTLATLKLTEEVRLFCFVCLCLALTHPLLKDSMTLLAKTAQHSSRVLKKGDQCALVALVSHLFVDPGRVMECMQRAVRIASGMAEAQAPLFALVLSHYLYYFAQGNENVTPQFLNAILELVATKQAEADAPVPLYQNTLKYLQRMKKEQAAKYGELKF